MTATNEIKSVEPAMGWHENIPAEIYHQWTGASSTRLNRMRSKSPAHVHYEAMHPQDATPAKSLGQAVHDCVLLPGEFGKRYFAMPDCDRRTKDGKDAWANALLEIGDRKPLKADDRIICRDILSAVKQHPMASRALYGGDGDYELSGIWTDPDSGCRCRMRADRFAEINGYPVIIDLKTTDSAAPEEFGRSVIKYGYDIQAALYLHGAAAMGRPVEYFIIVAVEKEPPFGVCVYRIPDDLVALGWEKCKPLLALYHNCMKNNEWPCYSNQILTLQAPRWAWMDQD